ncbi:hypothetical protein J7K18_03320 [bacterium]|nr:hypothetical protein [bacterium]
MRGKVSEREYRQFLSYKALLYAMRDKKAESEAIRWYLRNLKRVGN